MMLSTSPGDLLHRRLIVVGVAIVLLVVALVAYAVLSRRTSPAELVPPESGQGQPGQAQPAESSKVGTLAALPATADPEAFARGVAQALFGWDTATLVRRSDHVEQLMKVADPTGESTTGLLSDLNGYFPADAAWRDLAQHETRQWLSIESVTTPSTWAQAKTQAAGQLLPGTAAFTIVGVRHRAGVWNGEPVASAHDVAFTIFVVCGPSYPECRLLRLSILDKPLE